MPEIDLDSLKRLKAVAEKVPLQHGPRAEDARRLLLDWIGNIERENGLPAQNKTADTAGRK